MNACCHVKANKYEQILARRAEGISQNLHRSLQTHKQLVTDDITTALIEHTRSAIMYERQLLRELESLRPDINNANAKAPPKPNGVPRPLIVPPLEDYSAKPQPRIDPAPAPSTSDRTRTASPFSPGVTGLPSGVASPYLSGRSSLSSTPLPPQSPGAGSSKSFVSSQPQQQQQQQQPPLQRPAFAAPLTASGIAPSPTPIRSTEPPLGGHFVDGTKSMFVKPTMSSPSAPSGPQSASAQGPPLPDDPLSRPGAMASPLADFVARPATSNGMTSHSDGLDPIGQARPTFMSASMRVPTRPRLDAREAASKLANMF